MTENPPREVMTGFHKFLFSLCYYFWPEATPDEVRTFIYDVSGGQRMYSRGFIVMRTNKLGLRRTRTPTENYQPLVPQIVIRNRIYWTHPPPVGVVGIRRRQFVEVGEFGIELSQCNRAQGRAHTSIRVRKAGRYSRGAKLTVLLAVEAGDPNVPPSAFGSVEQPRVWHRILYQNGANQVDLSSFLDEICNSFEKGPAPGGCDNHRVFLLDDVEAHLTDLVFNTVHFRSTPNVFFFDIVPRPPCSIKHGPSDCSIWECIERVQQSVRSDCKVDEVATGIHSFLRSGFGSNGAALRHFHSCGYEYDG